VIEDGEKDKGISDFYNRPENCIYDVVEKHKKITMSQIIQVEDHHEDISKCDRISAYAPFILFCSAWVGIKIPNDGICQIKKNGTMY
jgi:hypothetical protein